MKNTFLIAFLFFSGLIFSQSTGAVSGTITDLEMNGEPLLYANVKLENTEWNAQTNLHGNFEIKGVALGNYVLAVSFPGYETLKIPVGIAKNDVVKIHRGLSAKSLDVGQLLVSELDTGVSRDVSANSKGE